jgi:hypothetical protein
LNTAAPADDSDLQRADRVPLRRHAGEQVDDVPRVLPNSASTVWLNPLPAGCRQEVGEVAPRCGVATVVSDAIRSGRTPIT